MQINIRRRNCTKAKKYQRKYHVRVIFENGQALCYCNCQVFPEKTKKNNQHVDFPSGHPPEYYPRLSLVNFAERTGCSSFRLIWPIGILGVYLVILRYNPNTQHTGRRASKSSTGGYRSPEELMISSNIFLSIILDFSILKFRLVK